MPVPFRDFAGSTVVHTVGGMIALVGAVVLGPRLGRKFRRDGGGMPAGHDMTIAVDRRRHPVVRLVRVQPRQHAVRPRRRWYGAGWATNTTLGRTRGPSTLRACSSSTPGSKKWDTGITVNGSLAGLVAITCPCYWVNIDRLDHHRRPSPASFRSWGVDLLERVRIDDPIGAVPGPRHLRHLGHPSAWGSSPPVSSASPARRERTPPPSSPASSGVVVCTSCGLRWSAASS